MSDLKFNMSKKSTEVVDNIDMIADGRETVNFRKALTNEEIQSLKNEYFETSLKIKSIENEVKELNKRKKEYKEEATEYQNQVTSGGEDIQINDAFFRDDYDNNIRKYYDPVTHELAYSRKLKATENQLRLTKSM